MRSSNLTAEAVHGVYLDGVSAVEAVCAGFSSDQWQAPACGRWTGAETARHLLAVARWYHDWLDRARAGSPSPPFPSSELDRRNDDELEVLAHLSGPEAVGEFAATARSYLDRAADHWDTPYGYPFGTVTVGMHCGVAAAEWHLHAWDLSGITGTRHLPRDTRSLFTAAGRCVAAARGGPAGRLMGALVPLGAMRNPWSTMLTQSGRA